MTAQEKCQYGNKNPYVFDEDLKLRCGAYFELDTILKNGAIGHVLVSGQMVEMEWDQHGAVRNKGDRIVLDKFEVVITNIYDFITIYKYYETAKNYKLHNEQGQQNL